MPDVTKVLAIIRRSDNPDQLRRIMTNARREGNRQVLDAAFARLVEVLPAAAPGTLEHEFWITIHAFEELLREERGKTVLLGRTRQKLQRDGVMKTLIDFSTRGTPTQGFRDLIERDLPKLTAEYLVLKHAEKFEAWVLDAARRRLSEAGIDVAELLAGPATASRE
ncbi:hypothetical protein LAZ40_06925 [Cereibacter sphaeroides]|uniref:hypothetical protein n=1 Tax=Cereibacter sphaeroides TaxID=1063 RepID=UPI001F2EF098|nr:hypothetical protein [Cereibacter sphaeroides]MCE6958780.1 hypothetical protein [Cereibacter sphaeroides]MCE6973346.1 hypothetical protein [Cereibacter sphaeroides]